MFNIIRTIFAFFKGKNKFSLFSIVAKNARTTLAITLNLFILVANVAFFTAYIYIFYFFLNGLTVVFDFFNNGDFYFLKVFRSLGIVDAFVDAYNFYSPILLSIFFIIASNVVLKVLHSFRDSLNSIFIARID